MIGRTAAARPAMQEYRRLGASRARPLPIDMVPSAHIQTAMGKRFDGRIKGAERVGHGHRLDPRGRRFKSRGPPWLNPC